ncbi:MAG TPA: hypothetical protein VN797_03475, partial [Gemmatimonadaceae bacterium]|nr:hypothetical protein [Gemmatimonadaceae bacterium]
MSESTATGASGVFARLDALLDAPERWIDRRDEGQTIAHEIANSPHSVIVLFGAPRAGKSELTRRWIVPALSGGFNVIFHDRCARPDAFADPPERMILFWDAFDACLTDDVTTAERGRELAG